MKRTRALVALVMTAGGASGCGPSLGSYQVKDVRLAGLYHYYVYLPAKPYKDGSRCDSCDFFPMPEQLSDLRTSRQSVCFRILTSSSADRKIFIPPVQSETIEVPANALANATAVR